MHPVMVGGVLLATTPMSTGCPPRTTMLALLALLLPLLPLLLLLPQILRPRNRPRALLILSLSPATHSPRALAHARAALVAHAYPVVALLALSPAPSLDGLRFFPIGVKTRGGVLSKGIAWAWAVARGLWDVSRLLEVRVCLVCVPPAVPVLGVVAFAARFLAFGVVCDWHNYGWTLVAGRVRRVVRWMEWMGGRLCGKGICVSAAFKDALEEEGIRAAVVYDRPVEDAALAGERKGLWKRVRNAAGVGGSGRPECGLCVTSTSWTPEEDFGVLFDALVHVEDALEGTARVVVVITGRGKLRAAFEERVCEAAFRRVEVWFCWLAIEDYPRLLSEATLGISLHASSSGLDLPMKIVDMLGAGLPVLSIRYACIGELVVEGETGLLFDDALGLARLIQRLLLTPAGSKICESMRAHVRGAFRRPEMLWQHEWEQQALPVIHQAEAR